MDGLLAIIFLEETCKENYYKDACCLDPVPYSASLLGAPVKLFYAMFLHQRVTMKSIKLNSVAMQSLKELPTYTLESEK